MEQTKQQILIVLYKLFDSGSDIDLEALLVEGAYLAHKLDHLKYVSASDFFIEYLISIRELDHTYVRAEEADKILRGFYKKLQEELNENA